MNAQKPHFLLFSESNRREPQGQWRFVLQALDGSDQLEATDEEPGMAGERLELLAVVRGLEALPSPARVTLVTPSRYVNRGLTQGLPEWRVNDWQWEHFGEMVPVKNQDLWQRIDRALGFHQVECRTWRFDLPHRSAAKATDGPPAPYTSVAEFSRSGENLAATESSTTMQSAEVRPSVEQPRSTRPVSARLRRRLRRFSLYNKRLALRGAEYCLWRVGQFGSRLVPVPWLF